MEVEAALILFQMSLEQHVLPYTTMLCDGHCQTFSTAQNAKVYGYIDYRRKAVLIMSKWADTTLRNLVQKQSA